MIPRLDLAPGQSLSRLAYGMWRLGDDADTSPRHIQAKIEACLGQGITTLDQADIYGDYSAEALLGACLSQAPGLRSQLEIVTKCDIVAPCGRYAGRRVKYYDTSPAHITASVDHSLAALQTDTIDLLLLHRPDPLMDHHATGAALDALVASGKVRAVGVSNFRPHDTALLQSGMRTRLCANQIELSLTAHEAFTNGDLAYLQERGILAMAWSPLGGGALAGGGAPRLQEALASVAGRSGAETSAVALAWLLAHPAGILPVIGTNRLDRIRSAHKAFDVGMDRQTWFELYTAALGREVA
jgi:predicted oxidoreductase